MVLVVSADWPAIEGLYNQGSFAPTSLTQLDLVISVSVFRDPSRKCSTYYENAWFLTGTHCSCGGKKSYSPALVLHFSQCLWCHYSRHRCVNRKLLWGSMGSHWTLNLVIPKPGNHPKAFIVIRFCGLWTTCEREPYCLHNISAIGLSINKFIYLTLL